MRRTSLIGLTTAALGLAVVVGGLRSAVLAGESGPCTVDGVGPRYWPPGCNGACPNGDACVLAVYSWRPGLVAECDCMTAKGGMYSPVDTPKCALVTRMCSDVSWAQCKWQGCGRPCGDVTYSDDHWTCGCAK
jgi:hypothetical protein